MEADAYVDGDDSARTNTGKEAYSTMKHKIRWPSIVYHIGDVDRTSTYAVLEAGLRPLDDVDFAEVLADLFAAAFGALAPVAAFLAGERLEAVVVFFTEAFFTVFTLAVFAGALAFVVDFTVAFFLAAVDLGGTGLAADFLDFAVVVNLAVGLATVFLVVALAVGLFSFAEVSALTFGASFTLPLTPLGSTKVPFSAPVEMALAS